MKDWRNLFIGNSFQHRDNVVLRMMLLLTFDIGNDVWQPFAIHRKSAIAVLPIERCELRVFLIESGGSDTFYLPYKGGDRYFGWNG